MLAKCYGICVTNFASRVRNTNNYFTSNRFKKSCLKLTDQSVEFSFLEYS